MSIVKIQRKGQMTLPTGVRTAVGLADGDLVDVKVSGRRAVDDYTPGQRRLINARLAEAEKGPYFGPFKNGAAITAFPKDVEGQK